MLTLQTQPSRLRLPNTPPFWSYSVPHSPPPPKKRASSPEFRRHQGTMDQACLSHASHMRLLVFQILFLAVQWNSRGRCLKLPEHTEMQFLGSSLVEAVTDNRTYYRYPSRHKNRWASCLEEPSPPQPTTMLSFGPKQASRKYVDLIHRAGTIWANWQPSVLIQVRLAILARLIGKES